MKPAPRVIFNNILPEEMQFKNTPLDKGAVKDLISEVYQVCGQEVTTEVADAVKDIGFEYAMRSGSTIAVSDITIPEKKDDMLARADSEVESINKQWRRGLFNRTGKKRPDNRCLAEYNIPHRQRSARQHGSAGKYGDHGELGRYQRRFWSNRPAGWPEFIQPKKID